MNQLFEDSKFIKTIWFLIPAISKFFECVKFLSKLNSKEHLILMDSNKTLLKYTVLLFEVSRLLKKTLNLLCYVISSMHTCIILGTKMETGQSNSCY